MVRKVRLEVTVERFHFATQLAYVASPETHSRLLEVPPGEGKFTGEVEIDVLDTQRYPEGSDPPFTVHTLIETWDPDRLRVESSAGLTHRAIRSMFPELFVEDDECARRPAPVVASVGHRLGVAGGGPVRSFVPLDDACGWCGEPMRALLDLDLTHPALSFLGFAGQRLRVMTCHGCTCYETLFTEVDAFGDARWASDNPPTANVYHGPPWTDLEAATFVVGGALTDPYDVDGLGDHDGTRLGGRPYWVQGPQYPDCPRCKALMPFLAQVDLADPPWNDEGRYYAFLDLACGVAATVYQQT